MAKFITVFFAAAAFAIPITIGLGIVYFVTAAKIVEVFRLNYGEKPIGFRFLNAALGLTVISYFLIFAFLLWSL
jgi:hypothetical protein